MKSTLSLTSVVICTRQPYFQTLFVSRFFASSSHYLRFTPMPLARLDNIAADRDQDVVTAARLAVVIWSDFRRVRRTGLIIVSVRNTAPRVINQLYLRPHPLILSYPLIRIFTGVRAVGIGSSDAAFKPRTNAMEDRILLIFQRSQA